MIFPRFSAEASHYKSNACYRGHVSVPQGPSLSGLVVPAYRPLPVTQSDCSGCNSQCTDDWHECKANYVTEAAGVACIFFPPACAMGGAFEVFCDASYALCKLICLTGRCCPKVCDFPDPLHPGSGCCDAGEHCVDENDPNSRSGCCPSDRQVCGDKCCASPEEICVGNFCCPPGSTTICNGVCCAGTCTPIGDCCPPPNRVCGNDCCPPFSKCCRDQCCPTGQECNPVDGSCWTPTHGGGISPCPLGREFCNGKCCPTGQMCCNSWWDPPGVADCHDALTCQPR